MESDRSKAGRFRKKKRFNGFSCVKDHDDLTDHDYGVYPDISNIALDVYATEDGDQWREGRRVVELGVLAEGLKHCSQCNQHLFLHDCLHAEQAGLAAVLSIPCSFCKALNSVPTGKKHDRTFDMNTKLGTALLHSGIGARQMNSILSSLNIPAVRHGTIHKRMKESGDMMETLARETADIALEAEVNAQGGDEIDVSVDAGWQKRGSGRAYDSMSGHCSMFGIQTGKIINFSMRSKDCRICKQEGHTYDHDCRRNWIGSAKAMEPDMVEEMVTSVQRKGVTVNSITGDDDSSTIARLRANVNKNIIKRSDKNHVKKGLSNSLYALKTHYPTLTLKVIKYILTNFGYMLGQNKKNPVGILKGLSAQSRHPFGDHSRCQMSWCKMLADKNCKHGSLPFGKPLSNAQLQLALEKLFQTYEKHADKLSNLGSTQSNESFNNVVASKAPKSHHFAGSASLNFRLAASVAQTNVGQQYVMDVHRKLGISPGNFTGKLCLLRDKQAGKRRSVAATLAAKRRRMQRKQERSQRKTVNELHEGPLYQSNLLVEQGESLPATIPEAVSKPLAVPLKTVPSTRVYFDLETTGLGRTEHIIQIAARRGEETFQTYVLPQKKMTKMASEVTKIEVFGDQLFYAKAAVNSVKISQAFTEFVAFLSETDDNLLVGHNCKAFDCPVLFNALKQCDMLHSFKQHVKGFADTRHVFKSVKPCTQQSLAKHFNVTQVNAHNAIDDVETLQKIVENAHPSEHDMLKCSYSVDFCIEMHGYLQNVSRNLPSLQKLVDLKIISSCIAKRIAGSALSFNHLLLAYKRNGVTGVDDLFSNTCSRNRIRVTKSQKIITAVGMYLSKIA